MKNAVTIDMLEIIFQHRNKAYGAYQLRRDYNKHLLRAFLLGVSFLVVLFCLPKLANAITSVAVEKPEIIICDFSTKLDIETPPPPPVQPPTPPPPTRATVQYVPPLIQQDDEVQDVEPQKVMDELVDDNADIDKADVQGNGEAPPTDDAFDKGIQLIDPPKKVSEENVFETFDIQKMPSFPGGDLELQKFLRDNIKYPSIAREYNIQGTVALSFVINKDGRISNIDILKDPGGGCGKEALRVVGEMPKWTPGEANGNPVKVRFTLPVKFRLTN
jgi:periplasmic protein TonB